MSFRWRLSSLAPPGSEFASGSCNARQRPWRCPLKAATIVRQAHIMGGVRDAFSA